MGIESQTLKISSKQRRGTISGGIQGSASSSAKPNDVPRLETMLLAPSPRSMAALQSSKWHLSTPRLVSGGPRFLSSTREKADATPRSSRRQDCSVPTTATQAFQSPRDFIKGIEKLRNADSVAALLRPPDLTRYPQKMLPCAAMAWSLFVSHRKALPLFNDSRIQPGMRHAQLLSQGGCGTDLCRYVG